MHMLYVELKLRVSLVFHLEFIYLMLIGAHYKAHDILKYRFLRHLPIFVIYVFVNEVLKILTMLLHIIFQRNVFVECGTISVSGWANHSGAKISANFIAN